MAARLSWLIRQQRLWPNVSEIATGFLKAIAYDCREITRNAGAFVNTRHLVSEQRAFSTEDILWAIGIWWVILTLTPVIIFYILMVA